MLHKYMEGLSDALLPLRSPLTETTVGTVTIVHHLGLKLCDFYNKKQEHIIMKACALGTESFSGCLVSNLGIVGMTLLLRNLEENKAVLTIHWVF